MGCLTLKITQMREFRVSFQYSVFSFFILGTLGRCTLAVYIAYEWHSGFRLAIIAAPVGISADSATAVLWGLCGTRTRYPGKRVS